MKSQYSLKPGARSAFSLLDLIVVLAVLFLLVAIFLPALNIARQKTQSEGCLNNLHQLSVAWLMYASANNDRCVNNFGLFQSQAEGSGQTYRAWCPQLDDWTLGSGNTNGALLQHGLLGPFLGGKAAYFKCPADNFLSPVQIAAGFSGRVRSYSMNGFCGLFSTSPSGDPTYLGEGEFDPTFRQFLKVSDISQPSSIFVFLDEHPDSINDGYYDVGFIPTKVTPTTTGVFGDIPASYHYGSAGFSFADGHAEIHQWLDPRRAGRPGLGIVGLPVIYAAPNTISDISPYSDIHWMWSHSSVKF